MKSAADYSRAAARADMNVGFPAMPNAAKDHDARAARARRALLLVAVAVPVVVAAIALPGMLGRDDGRPAAAAPAPQAEAPEPRDDAREAATRPAAAPAPDAGQAEKVEVSAKGDLEIGVRLRWKSVTTGDRIVARVRFTNHTPAAFHLPAEGEPHPTLALIVTDAQGNEVRRVVEAGSDQLPRRTVLVASGAAVEMPVEVVATGEEPLPPGEYTLHAEFRPDPAWARLGLPSWTAPNGGIRSDAVPLAVTVR